MTQHRPMRLMRLMLLLPLLVASCKQNTAPVSTLPTTPMTIGKKTYTLEIAARYAERDKGLMFRDSMPAEHGMIFVFTAAKDQRFWMRNTRIPLDILFLDEGGKVVSIHRMEPYDERGTESKGPAKYAVELNGGQAQTTGVKEGDVLQIPQAVKNATADP